MVMLAALLPLINAAAGRQARIKKRRPARGGAIKVGKRRGAHARRWSVLRYFLTKPIFCICALRAEASTRARIP